ncbi:MAG: hypothetical protein HW411_1595 [Gammaproteobacteria bacterium]|nr:hypothetical protein [Gammaproteobacteria bacterium]
MSENDILTITVYLIHGEPIKFEVHLSEAKELGLGEDIERSLIRSAMAVELDNKLIIIPYSNIQYIECDPAPSVLPLNMIRGAKHLLS